MDKLRYVFDAVTSIRKALNGRVPLIGFSGSPWTLACYMVEGAGSDDYRLVKTMLYQRPDLMHKMLAVNADAVAAYLNAQIEAGAQAVMIFDSWGGVLADAAFKTFSLAYTARVLAQLKREHEGVKIPRLVFTKGGGQWLEAMAQLDCEVLGLDWTVNLARARAWSASTGRKPRRCRATWIPTCCSPTRPRSRPRWPPCWTALAPPYRPQAARADPYFQPGPRHQPAHAAGERRSAGARSARSLSQHAHRP